MKHLAKLKEAFLKRIYQETTIDDQLNRLNRQKTTGKKNEKSTRTPLVITYNQTIILNFRKIVSENWSLLKINNRLKHVLKSNL